MKTWEEDLESLLKQRKNYFKSLKYLEEEASKVGRKSVGLFHEIENIKSALKITEDRIKEIENRHKDEFLKLGRLPIDRISQERTILEKPSRSRVSADYADVVGPILTKPARKVTPKVPQPGRDIPVFSILIGVLVIATVAAYIVIQRQPPINPSERSITGNSPAPALSHPIQAEGTNTLVIRADYYHLGDAVVENFNHPQPQANPYVAQFEIIEINAKTSYLTLYASHVDPNIEQAPVAIYINGILIDYLNPYFEQENLSPKLVTIPVDLSVINTGLNEIKLEATQTDLEYAQLNVDDFEFWGLTLHFE